MTDAARPDPAREPPRDLLRERVVQAVGEHYEIDAELGRGGMSVVYRATDRRLKRRVAIKILPPDFAFRADVRTRFLREAEVAAQLSHPHIVPIYSVDERDGLVFFVMAYVAGESLAGRAAREGPLPPEEVRRILREVADALAYAHAHGVIHRDIKPDNILLEPHAGRALVSDFGIARAAEADSRLTVTGIAVGTPAYMSPEQAMGDREVDGRSDLYSLGVVGYQTLTGELPFKASSTPAMMMKHVSERPRPIRELRRDAPPALAAAIERVLAKRPEDRYRDAAAFRDALAHEGAAGVAGEAGRAGRMPWEHRAAPLPPPARRPSQERGADRSPERPPDRPPERPQERPHERDQSRAGPLGRPSSERPPLGGAGRERHRPAWVEEMERELGMTPDAPAGERDRSGGGSLPASARAGMPPAPIPGLGPGAWPRPMDAAAGRDRWAMRPVEEQVVYFRRRMWTSGALVTFLGMINFATMPFFPWVIFPAFGMGSGLLRQWERLKARGVRWGEIWGKDRRAAAIAGVPPMPRLPYDAGGRRAALPGPDAAAAAQDVADRAARVVPRAVLAGPHGAAVYRAVEDSVAILAIVAGLDKADKALLPDVAPTVNQLVERVGALTQMLDRLDADISPEMRQRCERRIAEVEAEPEGSVHREQRLTMLRKQLATLDDLGVRRARVAERLDSALLALQTLRLDLLKLRSSGVQASIQDVTQATQEARALSREIGHVLDAAAELRSL